ncbi:hypothetical protein [Brucella sp. NBRC 12950]|uniref:hypothetical protein n=1 Tax=Brucella sp. NBRC 12950 TaxID=2994518 RepID=UPI0024A2824F|nr:hypothetical protein [Brucella sp. NBRC 12950]GLU28248.1 hypothetical protein Brsp01_34810 [Brucella sp. NBRC 12950]
MSTELYIAGFRHGKPAGLPVVDVLAVFGLSKEDQKGGFYALSYDHLNLCDLSVGTQNDEITDICILRPCGHNRLYSEVFSLLSSGPYVAFVPSGPLVAVRAEAGSDIPEDMRAVFGPPVTVSSASALKAELFE